eukprot:151558-Rhodomonas_salina.1
MGARDVRAVGWSAVSSCGLAERGGVPAGRGRDGGRAQVREETDAAVHEHSGKKAVRLDPFLALLQHVLLAFVPHTSPAQTSTQRQFPVRKMMAELASCSQRKR